MGLDASKLSLAEPWSCDITCRLTDSNWFGEKKEKVKEGNDQYLDAKLLQFVHVGLSANSAKTNAMDRSHQDSGRAKSKFNGLTLICN